jgi:hypothetical protein
MIYSSEIAVTIKAIVLFRTDNLLRVFSRQNGDAGRPDNQKGKIHDATPMERMTAV